MLVNSLILGLISYTGTIIYNLLAARSLEKVFFISLRFLISVTLMTFFLQLSFFLIKNLNSPNKNSESEESDSENEGSESKALKGENSKEESDNLEGAAVENEFEDFNNEDFSAFSPEEIDYQQ